MAVLKSTQNWPFLHLLPPPAAFHDESELAGVEQPTPGIYLLWTMDGQLVYIGQSSNIARRLGQHRGVLDDHGRVRTTPAAPEKAFQGATWTPVATLSDRLRIESLLILAAVPTYNRVVTVGIKPDGTLFDTTRLSFGSRRRRSAAARSRAALRGAQKGGASPYASPLPRRKARLGPSTRGAGA